MLSRSGTFCNRGCVRRRRRNSSDCRRGPACPPSDPNLEVDDEEGGHSGPPYSRSESIMKLISISIASWLLGLSAILLTFFALEGESLSATDVKGATLMSLMT